jgi:hypothetical protein
MGLLRKLFGPSKAEIWSQLSSEIDARYVHGGFWRGDKVQATHGDWTITLDTFSQTISTGKSTVVITYTRMRAPYVNRDGFRFTIYRRGIFSDIGKWFGMQDLEIGDAQFDRDFVIQGNDAGKLKALFARPRIRELISAQPAIHLSVKDDEGWFGAKFPEGVDELYFRVTGVIKDIERLKSLYELFAETLDHLCQIGSAYETTPGVEL